MLLLNIISVINVDDDTVADDTDNDNGDASAVCRDLVDILRVSIYDCITHFR